MVDSRARAVGVTLAVLLSALAVGVPVGTSTADESVVGIDSCTVITEPGRYELTADVGGATLDNRGCIEIRAENVTLDGNGHTVGPADRNSVFVGTAVPYQPAERLPNVTLRNLVATADVELYRTPGATVRGVTLHDAFLSVDEAPESVVENNTLLGTGARGASIALFRSNRSTVANNAVENSDQHGPDRNGIRLFVTEDVTVRENTIRSSSGGLFVSETRNATVSNNSIRGSSRSAIRVERGSAENHFQDNVLRDSTRGVTIDPTAGPPGETSTAETNTFVNTTAANISEWAFSASGERTTRVEDIHLESATVSFTGQGIRVRGVDSPPAVPSNLADVDSFVEVEGTSSDARAHLNLSYDPAALESSGVDESELRVYRRNGTNVYAPLAPRDGAGDAEPESWSPVPGTNGVDAPANYAYANLADIGFGEAVLEFADAPTTEQVSVTARLPRGGAVVLFVRSPALNSDYFLVTQRAIPPRELTTVSLPLSESLPFEDEDGDPLPEVEVTVTAVEDANGDGSIDYDKGIEMGPDRPVAEISTTVTFPEEPAPTPTPPTETPGEEPPGREVTDTDGDGLSDLSEGNIGTNPDSADTDGDGLNDSAEIRQHRSSPLETDTDDDGLGDGEEVTTSATDPSDWDTDADGYSDGKEVHTCGSNPTDPSDP